MVVTESLHLLLDQVLRAAVAVAEVPEVHLGTRRERVAPAAVEMVSI
jgi:hypothetical protein